jgi:hypothetical protein
MGVELFRSKRRRAGVVASVAVAVLLAAGCTTARNDLGTSVSSCYRALPVATKAVGSHGRLLAVQRSSLAMLRRQAPHLLADVFTREQSSQAVCVIAFQGHFTSASVSEPHGRSSGRLAVVVTTTPSVHLLGTLVFSHSPFGLGRSHFG